jgi:hypothetical protein
MIVNVAERTYLDTVYTNFIGNNDEIKEKLSEYLFYQLFNKDNQVDAINEIIENISSEIQKLDVSQDSKRYKFTRSNESKRDEVLRLIFERSFSHNPEAVIEAAQNVDPAQGEFYSGIKKVCWIQVPREIGALFESPTFKIIATVSALVATGFALYELHAEVTVLMAGKVLPFFINNTPIQVIQLGNAVAAVAGTVFDNSIKIFFGTFMATWIIRNGPEIPYLTSAARDFNLMSFFRILFHSPQTVFGFVLQTSFDTGKFVWIQCDNIGDIFSSTARNAESERLHISKQKANEIWKKIILDNAPHL